MMKNTALLLLILVLPSLVFGQEGEIEYMQPTKNLIVQGVPPIPQSLSKMFYQYNRYMHFKPLGWDPEKRELRVLAMTRAIQGMPSPQETGKLIAAITFAYGIPQDYFFDRQGQNIIFTVDKKGNEKYQLYFFESETKKVQQLTDGQSRNVEPVWSRRGDRAVWGYTPIGAVGMQLLSAEIKNPESRRMIVPSNGNPLRAFNWSPDDKQIAFVEYEARMLKSILWLADISTGKKIQLTPSNTGHGFYDCPVFTNDGRGLYLLSNQNSEYIQLAYLNIKTKKLNLITKAIPWDIEKFALSPDGKRIAFSANEDGISKLYLLDIESGNIATKTGIRSGVMSDIYWHNNSKYLAFSIESPQTPGDIYVLDMTTDQLILWAKANISDEKTGSLINPEIIKWKSFDNRSISGFLYRPPSTYSGRRPVLIEIHGGPEDQARPEFKPVDNSLVNELGIALICPNVRGSTGYGKSFAALDNGLRRVDALKDIAALFEWVKRQPDLDPDRIMVKGDSYGGYMALLTAVNYSDYIRGTICESGPSNLATYLDTTDGWRRDLKRQEYGDEQDPKIRQALSRVAPRNNTEKIRKPLLIAHGEQDSRIHVNESLAMIEAMRPGGITIWSIIAKNEGHSGFSIIQYAATVLFLKHFLLK